MKLKNAPRKSTAGIRSGGLGLDLRREGLRVATKRSSAMKLLMGVALSTLLATQAALAQDAAAPCGQLGDGYGPFDYRVERTNHLRLVEGNHFTPEVEQLLRGKTGSLGADIDYTLRAFPNHHRALVAMIRLAELQKTDQPRGMRYTVACWLERGLRWRPDDTTVRLIYAKYLGSKGQIADAVKELEYASELAGDNDFTHYNIGLIYLEIKDYKRALAEAHIAYKSGLEKPQLRDSLKALGQWVEPPEASASAASQASPTATPPK